MDTDEEMDCTNSDSEQQPCDECDKEYNEEYYAGCCRDGRCPLEKEFLCTDCGIYCEKLNCILCQMCLENYNAVLEEDKEFIVQ